MRGSIGGSLPKASSSAMEVRPRQTAPICRQRPDHNFVEYVDRFPDAAAPPVGIDPPRSASQRRNSGSGFFIGRDSRGRWTALGADGLVGGVFTSKDAALRYAQSEAGRSPGAVRLTSAPLELPFNRNQIGKGDGLPAWWRLGRAARGARSFAHRLPITGGADRRWLAIDLCLVTGLAALCLMAAVALS
jgi:hypothetical protein